MAVIKIAIQEEDQEPVAVTYFGDREGSELIIFCPSRELRSSLYRFYIHCIADDYIFAI
jgi:hypothetical protein